MINLLASWAKKAAFVLGFVFEGSSPSIPDKFVGNEPFLQRNIILVLIQVEFSNLGFYDSINQ